MADEIDQAQSINEQHTAAAIAAARWQAEGESLLNCAECVRPIPEARRAALPGVRLCLKCQELFERNGSGVIMPS
jgi:phage/conjugal plasmid C-4 type zinc finger TraR family protein